MYYTQFVAILLFKFSQKIYNYFKKNQIIKKNIKIQSQNTMQFFIEKDKPNLIFVKNRLKNKHIKSRIL